MDVRNNINKTITGNYQVDDDAPVFHPSLTVKNLSHLIRIFVSVEEMYIRQNKPVLDSSYVLNVTKNVSDMRTNQWPLYGYYIKQIYRREAGIDRNRALDRPPFVKQRYFTKFQPIPQSGDPTSTLTFYRKDFKTKFREE